MSTTRYFVGTLALFIFLSGSFTFGNASYDKAYQLKSNGQHQEAITAFMQAATEAKAAGDALTRFSSFYGASYSANRLSRNRDCLEYAEQALRIVADNSTASWTKLPNQPLFEIEMVGLIERSHYSLAQLGAGWQANRRGVELLRKMIRRKNTGALKPEEVLQLPSRIRHQGWRFIEREAEYLHDTGNTTAARELLEAAIVAAAPDLAANSYQRSYYPIKLIGKLGVIEGFTGDELRAIEIYKEEYQYAKKWSNRRNMIRIRFNHLSELADYQGADTASIQEADALLKEFEANGYNGLGAVKRVHARIVAEQLSADERLQILLEASRAEVEEESLVEAFYASRNALFVRAAENEPGLDNEFMQFLSQSRTQGNLRAEPRIYRRYGDWLRKQERFNEAIRVYRISLDRTLTYEWQPQAIVLYAKLAAGYLDSGQEALAFATITELNAYLEANPTIPPHAVLNGLKNWIIALLSNGYYELARTESQQWHAYGVKNQVPEKHLLIFGEKYVEAFIAKHEIAEKPEAHAGLRTFLHPSSVTTLGLPEQSARVAFFLLNPSAGNDSGLLKLSGTGLTQVSAPAALPILIQQTPSAAETVLSLPLSLPGGTLNKIYLQRDFTTDTDSRVSFEWISSTPNQTATAIWNYSQGPATERAAVIDAAEIHPNPFIGIPVEHTIYFPAEENQQQLPIRIRADQPFRIEYRHPMTGAMIAVDNNGNGDFSESGDFWKQDDAAQNKVKAPAVERINGASYASIEVWYFPNEAITSTGLGLSVEVYQDGEWIVQALDQITLVDQ